MDGDHSGDENYIWPAGESPSPDPTATYHGRTQEYHAIGVAAGTHGQIGLPDDFWDSISSFAESPPYSDAGGTFFGEQPVVTITEAYMTAFDDMDWRSPEASRRSDLQAGRIIGIALKVTDADAGPVDVWGREVLGHTYFLPGTWGVESIGQQQFLHDSRKAHSTRFADALLVPAREAGGDGLEQLATDTWARIKAQYMAKAALGPGSP